LRNSGEKTSMFIKLKLHKGFWIGIGSIIGITVGALTENIEILLPLGICKGVILESFDLNNSTSNFNSKNE
tara:strand:- start:13115 stop:13327 length:213 start_codon:yes stop_codon:yes gene_type:complete